MIFYLVQDVFVPFNYLHFEWKSLSQEILAKDNCLVIRAKHVPSSHQIVLHAHSKKHVDYLHRAVDYLQR